jgi:ubiquinone/menaquinone biosynthesis C-methylase UbiE
MPLSTPSALELKTIRALADFSGRRVLEIGSGDGRLTWPFALEAARWLALDPDVDDLGAAAQALRETAFPTVRVLIADGRALPVPSHYFDIAFFTWSLC